MEQSNSSSEDMSGWDSEYHGVVRLNYSGIKKYATVPEEMIKPRGHLYKIG